MIGVAYPRIFQWFTRLGHHAIIRTRFGMIGYLERSIEAIPLALWATPSTGATKAADFG
jgi:hypothetical protein